MPEPTTLQRGFDDLFIRALWVIREGKEAAELTTMSVTTARPAGRRLSVEGLQAGKESKEVH
jgi:hypothetical protein